MDFKDYVIKDFIRDLSGDLSSPGGGSTAALVSALAASLNNMVYSFTIDKKSFENLNNEEKQAMRSFNRASEDYAKLSLEYMDRDRNDFMALMDSFKLPKNTEDEKNFRKETITRKTIDAMNTPLNLAREAMKLYENIKFAVKFGNKNLISDGIVAAILLNSAIESAVVNVKINYDTLKGNDEFDSIPTECRQIIEESKRLKDEICNGYSF